MSSLDNVIKNVAKRNFDNHMISTIETLTRYRLIDEQIPGEDGSLLEFLLGMIDELDELRNKIESLENTVLDMSAHATQNIVDPNPVESEIEEDTKGDSEVKEVKVDAVKTRKSSAKKAPVEEV
jgi:uncharacterized coiled-coil DUF342 family protein